MQKACVNGAGQPKMTDDHWHLLTSLLAVSQIFLIPHNSNPD